MKATIMKSHLKHCARTITALLASTSIQIWAAEDATTSIEENRSMPWEKGAVALGGFVAFLGSDVTFGGNNASSGDLDAEDFLGLDSSLTVFRAGAMYRPGKSRRNQLDFSYASFKRDGSATLTEELTIGNVTHPIGATIETEFDFAIIRGTYSYAFWQTERVRMALGLGVYAIPLRYELDIETTGGNTAVEGADATLPLPAVALRGEFQLHHELFLMTSVEGMYLKIDEYEGAMLELNVGLEYRPWKHFGMGLAYSFMAVDVQGGGTSSDYPGADFEGEVDVRLSGLFLYGKFSF